MAERTRSVGDWIRGLLGGREKPDSPEQTHPLLGARAVETCEFLAVDAICRTVGPPRTPDLSADEAFNAFDRAVTVQEFGDAPAALAAACGLAMSGLRTAVFLSADRLSECGAQLRAAVRQRLPLVVQATAGPFSGVGIDAAIDSGAFVFVARDAQEACDLTLAAHRAADRSLTPGVVLLDGAESAWTIAEIALPHRTLVLDLVGDSDSEIDSPTRAQSLLFGERRRCVPRWFDLDNPLASGVRMSDTDASAAAPARTRMFAANVAKISAEALETVAGATGRPLSALRGRGLDEARRAVVGFGSALAIAETVADRLGREGGSRGGALTLTRLSPFPGDEVREALARAELITILERRQALEGSSALLEGVRAATTGRGTRLLRATCSRPVASELAALYANMQAGAAAAEEVHLGVAPLADAPDHPRRQALVQRARRDCPDLDRGLLDRGDPLDLRPRDARTVVLITGRPELPDQRLQALADALRETSGPHLRGRSEEAEPGIWKLVCTSSSESFEDPGAGLPADVILIEQPRFVLPDAELAENAVLVFTAEMEGAALWSALPARWRQTVRRNDLRLYHVANGEELIAAGASLAGEKPLTIEPLPWKDLPDEADEPAARLPLAVRKLGESTSGPASVARFWGEFAQPRLESPPTTPQVDPDLALGTVPACTAGFHAQHAGTGAFPSIDPDRCTACGKCWVSCPDTAIAAVAIHPLALLDAAAEWSKSESGGEVDAAKGKLTRAHRQLAARWSSEIAGTEPGAVEIAGLDDAFAWLIDKMKASEEERPAFEQAFAPTREWIAGLPLGHTEALFHDLEREQKGQGECQMLAVDGRTCQGCGICAAVCDDDAIRLEPLSRDGSAEARAVWEAWEQLPDTTGTLIARASGDSRIGPLAGVLLSRHTLLSLAGADGSEPGSGERVVARQISAVVEYQMQRRRLAQVKNLEELAERLRERIQQSLSQAFSVEDLGSLDQALDAAPRSRAPLGPVMDKLEELGQRTDVDVPLVRKLVRTAQRLERTVGNITRGSSGAGRARYGVVVSGDDASTWAATFPRNPFGVPVVLDRTGAATDLAQGLAHGFLDQSVREARIARRAELLLEAPSDLPARERDLDRLAWPDLSAEERRSCPPILILAEPGIEGLDGLLASDLPIKMVLLDPLDLRDADDPLLPAIARGTAYVAGTSPASPDHLFDCLTGALDFGGPALLAIHAPSPARHGFGTDGTIDRARLAVRSRVRPLVRFDPPDEGGLGRGLSLEGNPSVEEHWVKDENGEALTPATWAEGEERYSAITGLDAVVRRRARTWATLQEAAGVAAPYEGKLRERIRGELESAHKSELDALRDEYESKLREEEARQSRAQAAKLKERLMQLAGLRKAAGAPPETEGDS